VSAPLMPACTQSVAPVQVMVPAPAEERKAEKKEVVGALYERASFLIASRHTPKSPGNGLLTDNSRPVIG
jgi:hypothetical protein